MGPLIVAGATGYGAFPANSLEGATCCLATPIDGIEIDVQMTADGHVVAHHDYWLNADATRFEGRWLGARGPALKSMHLDELRGYDIGRLRPGSDEDLRHPTRRSFDGAVVPTLQELLALLKDAAPPNRLIYVEIKTDPINAVSSPDPEVITRAVLKDLNAAAYAPHAKIIAFDWSVLRIARALNPQIATAHLTIPKALTKSLNYTPDQFARWSDGADPRDFGGSELRAIKAHGGMEWSPYYTEVTAESVSEAQALGLKVGPWGLSKAEDIRRMVDLGVFSVTLSGPAWGV